MDLGYCRVSTTDSHQDTSITAQAEQLKAAGCIRVISERKSAYKDHVRPGWELCKELISSGQVRRFCIVSLSRGSRRQENAAMSELCSEHGVIFECLTGGPVDVSQPEGFLNVGIQDTINRFDSLIKSKRVQQGREARQRAGATAYGKCPYGYRYSGSKPEPDPKSWKAARLLWERLRDEEFSPLPVIRKYKYPFSRTGLYKWLRNPILKGSPAYAPHISVEPLVTHEEFEYCRNVLESRAINKTRAVKNTRLFSGLLTCESCQRKLNVEGRSRMSKNGRRYKCMRIPCKYYGKGISENFVRSQPIDILRENVDKLVAIVQTTTQPKHFQLTEDQKAAQQLLDRALALKADGIDVSNKSIADLKRRLLPADAPALPNWDGFAEMIRFPGLLEKASDKELRAIFFELISEFIYVGNTTEIKIRIQDCPDCYS